MTTVTVTFLPSNLCLFLNKVSYGYVAFHPKNIDFEDTKICIVGRKTMTFPKNGCHFRNKEK